MAPIHDNEELEARVEAGLAQRLVGNEYLKQGELSKALLEYHHVILSLKGLDNSIQNFFGGIASAGGAASPTAEGKEKEEDDKPEEVKKGEELKSKIKTALALTHLNMAVVQIKKEKWSRALTCAQESVKILPEGPHVSKAKFREAQARIGLGELTKGKQMLMELQKTNPDVAISNALKQLVVDDKARSVKSDAAFKGLYSAKNSSVFGKESPASTPAAAATPIKDDEPRFSEIDES